VTERRWLMAVITVLAIVVMFFSGFWGAFALYYQLPGGRAVRLMGSALWTVAVVSLIVAAIDQQSWMPLAGYAVAFLALLAWWSTIAPSNHRIWSDDVARLMTGTVQGHTVTLVNVRNFQWRTEHDYDARWETRRYDLDHLDSADAVLSYWGSAAIAHAMLSFGFDDGTHVVFSVEIRKKRHESYSSVGGFFKQFEMILTAAEESDIIRVRTNVRGEDDYLYPLRMDKAALRALFVSYVEAANRLAATPRFYNSITSNCTTVVYRMARKIDPGLPMDVRLLLTGYLPQYLYGTGTLDRSVSLDELRRRGRITDRARSSVAGEDFSRVIRSGMSPRSP
jgi:Domain of unknown function (DUF4105)